MKKLLFKKILNILDTIELQGISLHDTPLRVYEVMVNDYYAIKLSELTEIIMFLHQHNVIKETKNGIDLYPAPTIYAKSNQNSGVEALSLLETFLHDVNVFTLYKQLIKQNDWMHKQVIIDHIGNEIVTLFQQTILFETVHEQMRFQPKLIKGISDILSEYEDQNCPLISITLTALFTSSIVSHEDLNVDYKNTLKPMNDYTYKNIILNIIPRRGIPHDRDETKALQSFYKDTLFHEFDHACPLCNINIPHMLIASHIKPFRDCAHIFEAIDHNNGLLLCRNHDYLFDQGYFTFDAHGYIILNKALLDRKDLSNAYVLFKNYQLPILYQTKERMRFFEYHRKHIYKDEG